MKPILPTFDNPLQLLALLHIITDNKSLYPRLSLRRWIIRILLNFVRVSDDIPPASAVQCMDNPAVVAVENPCGFLAVRR